jgi:hypothetical protein
MQPMVSTEVTVNQSKMTIAPRCIDKEGEAKDWTNGILFLDTQSVISVFLKMADDK